MSVQALGLAVERLGLEGTFWRAVASLNDNFGNLGGCHNRHLCPELAGISRYLPIQEIRRDRGRPSPARMG
jgi:hypothetical protein